MIIIVFGTKTLVPVNLAHADMTANQRARFTIDLGNKLETQKRMRSIIFDFKFIDIRGLMAIPMYQPDHDSQYKTFAKVKDLFDSLVKKGYKLDTLSVGMSSDYNAAIAAGSTIVRIGSSIFGERKK